MNKFELLYIAYKDGKNVFVTKKLNSVDELREFILPYPSIIIGVNIFGGNFYTLGSFDSITAEIFFSQSNYSPSIEFDIKCFREASEPIKLPTFADFLAAEIL